MKNRDIAHFLERIGALLELRGENPFKVRAYNQAAREIEGLPSQLDSPDIRLKLETIPGIGEAIGKKILDMVETGKSAYLEELEREFTPDVREMLRIPGLGPKRLRVIIETLGVHSIGELEYACLENRIRLMKGFGEKTQDSILRGIELVKRSRGFLLFHDGMILAEALQKEILNRKDIRKVVPAGGLRRCSETINEIVMVVDATDNAKNAGECLMETIGLTPDSSDNQGRISGLLSNGIRCSLVTADTRSFPIRLLEATGSPEHLEMLRTAAEKRNITFRNGSMFRANVSIDVTDEREIYQQIGLEYIPPELREGNGEIEASRSGFLPRLVESRDIRGCFHVHTSWSDGSNTIEEMANAALSLGMEYIGISDHSITASYAGGLSEGAVRRQWDEIDQFNRRNSGIHVFKGVECDIRGDGSPDYDDSLLDGYDFVIVSVHSRFKMEREEMTARIIRAVSHPRVTMLGHPTGRLLLAREPYAVDMERVIDACAEHGTMIELNADPHRFDLDWRWHRYASERGVLISINPDAHSTDGLANVAYGVNIARKGWLQSEHVLNTRSLEQVRENISMKTLQRA